MSLNASIRSTIAITRSVAGDIETASSRIDTADALTYNDGTGAGQANLVWSDRRTLAPSANESLDLAGSLSGLLGAANFAAVKFIKISAAPGNANNVVVSRPASNGVPFVDADEKVCPDIRPGGKFEWGSPDAAGVVVTPSTGDLLNIANSGGTTDVVYDIVIIGNAAA